MDRRNFVKSTIAGLAIMNTAGLSLGNVLKSAPAGVGMCDWNLGTPADPSFIEKAARVGLEGIQVSIGTDPDRMPLRQKSVRKNYLENGKKHDVTFHSVAAGSILNRIPLATEPQSAVYVIDALEAANALGAKNILTAFFGNGDLLYKDADGNRVNTKSGKFAEYQWKEKEVERVIAAFKQIVPRAEDLGVLIGLENTLTASQNLQIIDAIGSPVVQVYYDVGNSWGNGYDVPSEIRKLGNDRICEVHLKDWKTKLLGSEEGQVDMQQCATALNDIGYDKWLVLETSGRENHFEADTKANVAFAKKTFF